MAPVVVRPKAYIPGKRCPPALEEKLQVLVSRVMGTRPNQFPGSQPVSFTRANLEELEDHDYFLCEKSDGIRVLLFCTKIDGQEHQYFIDRKNEYYAVPHLHFPSAIRRKEPLNDTLIDGELVISMATPTSQPQLTFLAFDCMVLEGENICDRPFDRRLGRLHDMVIKPYLESRQRENPVFTIKLKSMNRSYGTTLMFNSVLPGLTHDNDGLIFTRRESPYKVGTDENILKWKPPHENSIDFRLKLGEFPNPNSLGFSDEKPTFQLYIHTGNSGGRLPWSEYAPLELTDEEWEVMKGLNEVLDGRVIECFLGDDNKWHYKPRSDGTPLFRDDKPEANHISTVKKVMISIKDRVDEHDLMNRAEAMKRGWKEREIRQAAQSRRILPPSRG